MSAGLLTPTKWDFVILWCLIVFAWMVSIVAVTGRLLPLERNVRDLESRLSKIEQGIKK
jgi:hypothetical protein